MKQQLHLASFLVLTQSCGGFVFKLGEFDAANVGWFDVVFFSRRYAIQFVHQKLIIHTLDLLPPPSVKFQGIAYGYIGKFEGFFRDPWDFFRS